MRKRASAVVRFMFRLTSLPTGTRPCQPRGGCQASFAALRPAGHNNRLGGRPVAALFARIQPALATQNMASDAAAARHEDIHRKML